MYFLCTAHVQRITVRINRPLDQLSRTSRGQANGPLRGGYAPPPPAPSSPDPKLSFPSLSVLLPSSPVQALNTWCKLRRLGSPSSPPAASIFPFHGFYSPPTAAGANPVRNFAAVPPPHLRPIASSVVFIASMSHC